MDYQIQSSTLKVYLILNYIFVICLCHSCCKVEKLLSNNGKSGFVAVDCNRCGLSEIPGDIPNSTSVLRLRHNNLNTIPEFSFAHLPNLTVLDLFDNPIHKFEKDSFNGLALLQHLDLRRMEHHLQQPLPPEVFHPLPNLLTLKLDNIFPGNIKEIPKSLFARLGNLTFLQLAVPEAFTFGGEFGQLKKLQTLVIFGWNCNLGAINKDTFAVFAEIDIKVLEVRDCTVAHVEPSAFEHFPHLSTLNLACNKQGTIKNFFEAVRQVPSTNLTTLILDGSSSDRFETFNPKLVRGRVFQQLTHLSLRSTKILKIDPDVFLELPKLEHLTFGFNILLFSPDNDFYNRTAHILNAMRLRALDISHFGEVLGGHNNFRHSYCRNADMYSEDFFRKVPKYITLPEPKNLPNKQINYTRYDDPEGFLLDNFPSSVNVLFAHSLASRNTKLNGLHLSGENNVVYMDFSFLPIKWFAKPLVGLAKLQGLDLSSCRIESIVPDAFSYLPSLINLNLTRNNLKLTDLQELLQNVTALKYLDISFNDLETIPNETFTKMENLTFLILKGNHINQLHFNISGNHNIALIDLSLCALPYIEKDFFDQLETIQYNYNKNLTIDLSGNMFECECPAISFIEWLSKTSIEITNKEHLECRYQDINTTITSVDLAQLKRRCSGWPSDEALVTIAVGIITLSTIAVFLAFEYRWSLRWYYYKSRRCLSNLWRKLSQNHNQQREDGKCKVFISYDQQNDPEWVEDILLQKIEDEWEMTTCLVKRDFDAGLEVIQIAYQAEEMSQFTIIVISSTYEEFCFHEMRMAIEKGIDHIIVIYKERVDNRSETLNGLLSVVKCLEYSEEPDRLEMFWGELRDILSCPQ